MRGFRKAIGLSLILMLLMMCFALPAFARTIYGNGTGGIYINIDGAPYSDAWDSRWGNPYGTGGCTWFAEARTEELTGINCAGIIYGVDQWYNTVCDKFGFPRSQSLDRQHKSLICWSSPHIAVVEGFTPSGEIIVSEGGVNGWGVNSSHGYCRISTVGSEAELKGRNGGFMGYIILPVQAVGSTVSLDVNGLLDGENSGSLGNYGTCDVYINGNRVADDVADYYNTWPIGTTYSITDIRAKSGYEYKGVSSGSLEGTLTATGANVRLNFLSYGTLEVNGLLDGANSSTLGGFGTFDLYINGSLKVSGVNSYSQKWPQGSTYEVKNVQSAEGKYYNGVSTGALTGTLGKGTTSVRLSFSTILTPGPEWQEVQTIPAYLDTSVCEIQYNNHYEKTATTSPGDGWTQVSGSGVTSYVNSGGVYESDFPLSTSGTRVHVGTYYYHYCASGAGDVEHYNDGYHTVYHNVGDINNYYTDWEGPDSSDSRYTAYRIKWVSGQWANGYAYCSLGSPAVYYRRYQYQDRVAVTNYTWTKDSGWTTQRDSAATSVKFRFRLKQYAVSFNANGGEDAPADAVKYHGIDFEIPVNQPTRKGYRFTGWGEAANGPVKYAAGGVYTNDAAVTLYAIWTPAARLKLPAGTTIIGEEAFVGIDAVVIEVQEGCVTIGNRAFADNNALEQIYLPASVRNIAFDAFEGCGKVTIYAPEGSQALKLAQMLNLPCEAV